MTLFVDASALVAIIAEEPEGQEFANRARLLYKGDDFSRTDLA